MEAVFHEAEVAIRAAPEAVYPWLAEPARLLKWIGGLQACEPVGGGAPGVGTRFREVLLVEGRREAVERVITEWAPGAALGYRVAMSLFAFDGRFELEEAADGATTVRYTQETEGRGIGFALLKSTIDRGIAAKIRADLDALRRAVERESRTA